MAIAADRVKETTTTTGTGDITLAGAVTQFVAFQTAFALNERIMYAIVGQSGTEWEVGYGYLSGTTTLVREIPTAGSAATPVSFSAGTKDVFNTITGDRHQDLTTKGRAAANMAGMALP